jgi:hypothetical protein
VWHFQCHVDLGRGPRRACASRLLKEFQRIPVLKRRFLN